MDPHGYAVPLGSHMRRINPRDTAENTKSPPYDPSRRNLRSSSAGGRARGRCRARYRSFRHLRKPYPAIRIAQNVWVNDRNFHELGNERDPIIGNHDGTLEFKIPKRPIRKKITGLPAFTTVRGGALFFLPALRPYDIFRLLMHRSDVREKSAMNTLEPARTYNQSHVQRKFTPGKRRLSIYWTWSYPWEAQRDPAAIENQSSTMTEVRNVLWPSYETPEYSAAQFLREIAGTLELFHRSTLSFQDVPSRLSHSPMASTSSGAASCSERR